MPIRSISLLLLLLASSVQASNFIVSTTADSGAGSLRQAILSSNSAGPGAHTITFSTTFPNNGVIKLNSNLPQILSPNLTVAGGIKQPRIDGQSLRTIFDVSADNSNFELSDLVLQNAWAPEKGACVNSGNSSSFGFFRADRVTFISCQAKGPSLIRGGAIYWNRKNSSISVIDSKFLDNEVTATDPNGLSEGGAIYTNADLISRRSVFEGNGALATTGGGLGGAISLGGSNKFNEIKETTFRFNGASPGRPIFGYGGAVYAGCDNCETIIERSYLRGNSANFGGAVYVRKPSSGTPDVFLTLVNSTFYNNSVVDGGGAVYIGARASLGAWNNTFYNGDASSGSHLGFYSSANVHGFQANLLAPTYIGNACAGTPTVSNDPGRVGFNLFSDVSCASLAADALPNSPLGSVFVDERPGQIGVVRFSGSAVIDSIADPNVCTSTDARSQARPIDGDGNGSAECDVGAYEDPRDIIFMNGFEA